MINWIEKGTGLIEELSNAGFSKVTEDGVIKVYPEDQHAAAQVIIDNYDPIFSAKAAKRQELKREVAKRANDIYGFLSGEDEETDPSDAVSFYTFASDLYTSIKPGSRTPLSGNLLNFKAVHDVAVAAISDINALTQYADVLAYDVVNDPAWP